MSEDNIHSQVIAKVLSDLKGRKSITYAELTKCFPVKFSLPSQD